MRKLAHRSLGGLRDELIARAFPALVRRSLRRGLHQVWLRFDPQVLPPGAYILASNHHSWWDLYLVFALTRELGRPVNGLMLERTLERFPFFRRLGVLAPGETRSALRRLRGGEILQLFPEGELRPAGPVAAVAPGLEFFAARAGVPVAPLALRVVLRGAERPEALVLLGAPLPPEDASAARFREAINALLAELDAGLRAWPPEAAPPGFAPYLPPTERFDARVARLMRWEGR